MRRAKHANAKWRNNDCARRKERMAWGIEQRTHSTSKERERLLRTRRVCPSVSDQYLRSKNVYQIIPQTLIPRIESKDDPVEGVLILADAVPENFITFFDRHGWLGVIAVVGSEEVQSEELSRMVTLSQSTRQGSVSKQQQLQW